ncbi:MAG: transporter substrate-binding domain-containing protein [Rhodobacteraceae bacterium]|nr:transporter substrate-binding domain-containing protein [Paracoccaceae bacterium]
MKTVLIASAALALTAAAALAQDVVRMGTEGAYPPFNFIDDATGEVAGFDIDVGNEACSRAELNCEWVKNDWDSIIPNLVSGNFDTIMAGMSITPERDAVIDFTQNYLPPEPSAYAALSDDVEIGDAVIAAQTGTIQAGYVVESGATIVEFPTPDDTIAAVKNGEADAVLADKAFLEPFVNEDPDLFFVADDVLLGGGLGVGLRESDTELKIKLDAAIQSMKDDGSLNELIAKWFDERPGF